MCIDFNVKDPSFLCIGCYDGTVMVYDIRNKVSKPIFKSTVRTNKHSDPVWQVKWGEQDSEVKNF